MTSALKTWIYLFILTAFVMTVGELLGGRQGLLLGFVVAVGMNFFSYFYSDKLVLSMYSAVPVEGTDPFGLQVIVVKLAKQIGIPKPRVFIIPSETPNAFATGRSPAHASVAATEGILRLLSREELEGVLAHELTHVNHRDTLIMAVAATLGTAIMFLSGSRNPNAARSSNNIFIGLLISIVAPVAATLIRFAISHSREFDADSGAASLTQNPQALASALWKIHNYSQALPMATTRSTAHMFIINPLLAGGINSLFSTHPPVQERIKKLIGRTL
jgi:heat shock protein HtpX